MSAPQETPSAAVPILSREEFLAYFKENYGDGQHVTFLGPTQRGKTTLAHQMLHEVISPKRKCVVLAGKPPHRDPVMAKAAKRLNLDIVEEWPPTAIEKYKNRKKNGYVVRPVQSMKNHSEDSAHVAAEFRKAMMSCYASTVPVILVVDEAHHVQNEYKLRKELEAPLMRGAPHCGVWCLVQRGAFMSYHVYDAPTWFLIAYDPDVANQKRYAEIGGIDPKFLARLLTTLQTTTGDDGRSTVSEFVCIRRSGPELFIVDIV